MGRWIEIMMIGMALVGCGRQEHVDERLMNAEHMMLVDADSVFRLLNLMGTNSVDDEDELHEYALLKAEAALRSMHSMNDTMLANAAAYYDEVDDYEKLARAKLLRSIFLMEEDSTQLAIEHLIAAEYYALRCANGRLNAGIHNVMGEFFHMHHLDSVALQHFQKAVVPLNEMQDSVGLAYTYSGLAKCYYGLNETDSFAHYYNQAKCEIEKINHLPYGGYVDECLLPALYVENKYEEAKRMLGEIYRADRDKYAYYHGMGDCFLREERYDSASVYLRAILSDTTLNLDVWRRQSVIALLEQISKKTGDYTAAYRYLKDGDKSADFECFISNMRGTVKSDILLDDKEELKDENEKIKNWMRWLLIALVVMGISSAVIYLIIKYRNMKNRIRMREYMMWLESQNKERIVEKNRLLEKLEKMQGMNVKLKDDLVRRMGMIKQITNVLYLYGDGENQLNQVAKKIEGIVSVDSLSMEALQDILPVANELYGGLMDELAMKHQLNQKDLLLCAFVRCGFSAQEMSVVYGIPVENIYTRFSRLRRKIDLRGSLFDYFKEVENQRKKL